MFKDQHSKPQNRIDSLIGAGTRIEGNVHFSGGLRVDGEINGNIIAEADKPSTLVLSEQARVTGEINVTHLVVNGAITGPVRASEYMELQSKAKVIGDVCYKALEVHLGATVTGKLTYLAPEAVGDKVVALKLGNGE